MGQEAGGSCVSKGRTCAATAPCWPLRGAQPASHMLVFCLPPASPGPRPPIFGFSTRQIWPGPQRPGSLGHTQHRRALHTPWDTGTLSVVHTKPRCRLGPASGHSQQSLAQVRLFRPPGLWGPASVWSLEKVQVGWADGESAERLAHGRKFWGLRASAQCCLAGRAPRVMAPRACSPSLPGHWGLGTENETRAQRRDGCAGNPTPWPPCLGPLVFSLWLCDSRQDRSQCLLVSPGLGTILSPPPGAPLGPEPCTLPTPLSPWRRSRGCRAHVEPVTQVGPTPGGRVPPRLPFTPATRWWGVGHLAAMSGVC